MNTEPNLEKPVRLELLAERDVAALHAALTLYSSLGVGQWESVYWLMLRTGVAPVNNAILTYPEVFNDRLQRVAVLLHEIKELLGLPPDTCLPITHPAVHDLARRAHHMETQLELLLQGAVASQRPN